MKDTHFETPGGVLKLVCKLSMGEISQMLFDGFDCDGTYEDINWGRERLEIELIARSINGGETWA